MRFQHCIGRYYPNFDHPLGGAISPDFIPLSHMPTSKQEDLQILPARSPNIQVDVQLCTCLRSNLEPRSTSSGH